MDAQLLGTLAALGPEDRVRLRESSRIANQLERKWRARFYERIEKLDDIVFPQLWERGQFATSQVDFLALVLEHSYNVMSTGMRSAEAEDPQATRPRGERLSVPAGPRIPKSLAELRTLYDRWRKKKYLPPRQRAIAEKLKRTYIRRCQSVWDRYGAEFRKGNEFNRSAVRRVLESEGDMARSRADMTAQTETTYYFNRARRKVYDRSSDVTHYLFVAIRDQATTKWCRTRQGLVYAKSDPLLATETPPCHWNCRSEILPLSRLNPRHLRLIEDKSRARRSNRCEPLPNGWGGR